MFISADLVYIPLLTPSHRFSGLHEMEVSRIPQASICHPVLQEPCKTINHISEGFHSLTIKQSILVALNQCFFVKSHLSGPSSRFSDIH